MIKSTQVQKLTTRDSQIREQTLANEVHSITYSLRLGLFLRIIYPISKASKKCSNEKYLSDHNHKQTRSGLHYKV